MGWSLIFKFKAYNYFLSIIPKNKIWEKKKVTVYFDDRKWSKNRFWVYNILKEIYGFY